LLAPGQEFFLRENLKLRLLNARAWLCWRVTSGPFRKELEHSRVSGSDRYFDAQQFRAADGRRGLSSNSLRNRDQY
jgi:uncharacterized protein HemX